MGRLIRGLLVLSLCLAVIGLYRGWFIVSGPSRETETDKVNINVTVDTSRMKSDAEKTREMISEKVAQRAKQRDAQTTTQAVK